MKTLESTIASATKLAHLFTQLQPRVPYASSTATQRYGSVQQHTTSNTTSNTTETAMDLSNLTNSSDSSAEQLAALQNSSRPRPSKLTPEERERCFKLGLCFRCRQSGHRSNQCPQFTSASNPKKF